MTSQPTQPETNHQTTALTKDEKPKMSVRCNKKKACTTVAVFSGVAFFITFLVVPAVWRYSPSIEKRMLFLNQDYLPAVRNYSHPEVYGMNGTRNFYIDSTDNVTLGAWHVLPQRLLDKYGENGLNYERLLSAGAPIVVYMHGNSGTRANNLRLELYRRLRNINCHVIAVDYRGYADSTDVDIDEAGLVSDAKATYKWVYERANGAPIFGWGHSLGTGIGAHAFSSLETEKIYPSGLVLEAPFNKMSEAIREYSTAKFLRYLPWFDFFIIDPVMKNGIVFDTEENLMNANVPVLILHARDDVIIPYQLSEKLFTSIKKSRRTSFAELVLYDTDYRYGHQFIVLDKNLQNRITKFMKNCLETQH